MANLKRNYHDATLSEVRFSGADVVLVADVDGHWNNKCPERGCLFFFEVANLDEVRRAFDADPAADKVFPGDEIIGIFRESNDEYLIDLAKAGLLTIRCKGISEA